MKLFKLILLLTVVLPANAQVNWVKEPAPVLPRSAIYPNWDALATADACVLLVNDTFKIWYSGAGWLSAGDTSTHVRIGYAWSLDGLNWNQYAANPVLDRSSSNPNAPDYYGTETANVVYDSAAAPAERYRMWYSGKQDDTSLISGNYKVCYATSPNGINWTKYAGNPVLTAGSITDWNNLLISNVSVLLDIDTFKLWFAAPDGYLNSQITDGKGNIGYATSVDGINWTKYPNPVLVAGVGNSPDSAVVAEPSVIKIGNTYHMWYSMINSWAIENFSVGYATSADGINWTKYSGNPVLPLGGLGTWDRYWSAHPGVVYNPQNGDLFMYYTGRDSTIFPNITGYYWDLGLARSSIPVNIQISDNQTEPFISIYPVPANQFITITTSIPVQQITITDLPGRIIMQETIPNTTTTELQLSQLPPGNYIISVKLNTGVFVHRQVLKE
ncbi:MAG: T9SS type A sorting domain-containing protein [Bacteroidia bacterium]